MRDVLGHGTLHMYEITFQGPNNCGHQSPNNCGRYETYHAPGDALSHTHPACCPFVWRPLRDACCFGCTARHSYLLESVPRAPCNSVTSDTSFNLILLHWARGYAAYCWSVWAACCGCISFPFSFCPSLFSFSLVQCSFL